MDKPLQIKNLPAALRKALRIKAAQAGITIRQFVIDYGYGFFKGNHRSRQSERGRTMNDLSWTDIAIRAGFVVVVIAFILLIRWWIRFELKARKDRQDQKERVRVETMFPSPNLTKEQWDRVMGHPSANSAGWFAKQNDWREK